MTIQTLDAESSINRWGNSLALRLNRKIATMAGVVAGTPIRIHAEPGRIVIETITQPPTLDEMLLRFDPVRHGGEAMVFPAVGNKAI